MDQVDATNEVSPAAAKAFRTCGGILLYLACDLPHCHHIVHMEPTTLQTKGGLNGGLQRGASRGDFKRGLKGGA